MKRALVVCGLLATAATAAGCAAESKPAMSREPRTPTGGYPAPDSPAQQPAQPGYPAPTSTYAQPPAASGYPAPPPMPAEPSQTPAGSQVELDRAQRELDVAAGDCHNACRALSSMDRAAGRVCALSSGNPDDTQRCTSAKTRVYSARDKVKNSCGQCPDTSVDRNAPIPSR